MAKIYYRMIKTGRMIIDEVPTLWRRHCHAGNEPLNHH